jgi:hypothetical protein
MFKGDKDILRSLAKPEWFFLRELGVSNKELPVQDEFEGHVCRFLQINLPKFGKLILKPRKVDFCK